MRLVQQPSRTCWQLSSSSPVCGSSNDPARPPRLLRASSRVTRMPAASSATAQLIPASPPPTTIALRISGKVDILGDLREEDHESTRFHTTLHQSSFKNILPYS